MLFVAIVAIGVWRPFNALSLTASATRLNAPGYIGRDFRVIDGDTVQIRGSGERIRIENIDAAETGERARCSAELEHGEAAKAEARRLFESAHAVDVRRGGTDIYGRTLARVALDGRDFGATLMRDGLARPWLGHREPWCAEDGSLLP